MPSTAQQPVPDFNDPQVKGKVIESLRKDIVEKTESLYEC